MTLKTISSGMAASDAGKTTADLSATVILSSQPVTQPSGTGIIAISPSARKRRAGSAKETQPLRAIPYHHPCPLTDGLIDYLDRLRDRLPPGFCESQPRPCRVMRGLDAEETMK